MELGPAGDFLANEIPCRNDSDYYLVASTYIWMRSFDGIPKYASESRLVKNIRYLTMVSRHRDKPLRLYFSRRQFIGVLVVIIIAVTVPDSPRRSTRPIALLGPNHLPANDAPSRVFVDWFPHSFYESHGVSPVARVRRSDQGANGTSVSGNEAPPPTGISAAFGAETVFANAPSSDAGKFGVHFTKTNSE